MKPTLTILLRHAGDEISKRLMNQLIEQTANKYLFFDFCKNNNPSDIRITKTIKDSTSTHSKSSVIILPFYEACLKQCIRDVSNKVNVRWILLCRSPIEHEVLKNQSSMEYFRCLVLVLKTIKNGRFFIYPDLYIAMPELCITNTIQILDRQSVFPMDKLFYSPPNSFVQDVPSFLKLLMKTIIKLNQRKSVEAELDSLLLVFEKNNDIISHYFRCIEKLFNYTLTLNTNLPSSELCMATKTQLLQVEKVKITLNMINDELSSDPPDGKLTNFTSLKQNIIVKTKKTIQAVLRKQ